MADQPWVTRWLLFGKVKRRVQPLIASPTFRMVMLAVKPPCHWLLLYVTLQPGAAYADVAGRVTRPAATRVLAPANATTFCRADNLVRKFMPVISLGQPVTTSGTGAAVARTLRLVGTSVDAMGDCGMPDPDGRERWWCRPRVAAVLTPSGEPAALGVCCAVWLPQHSG